MKISRFSLTNFSILRLCMALVASAIVVSAFGTSLAPVYRDPSQPLEARVNDLLSRMTLQEKLALIHGNSKFTTAAIPRLNIPRRWLSDGPHGVREDVGPNDWTPVGRTDDFSTYLPVEIALASTWNPGLAYEYGQVIGQEALKRGKDIMLGPGVNIMRTPLDGRNFEFMGEDPYLTSQMAVDYIRGLQSQDVSACVKHFVANNQEWERGSINEKISTRALREIYLPAFKAAVQEGHVWSVMSAYNKVNGEYCSENRHLLTDILKKEWGFKGLVVSDWDAVHDTVGAVRGGLDLEMGTHKPYNEFYMADPFEKGIKDGTYPMSMLNDKVRRNLREMFATGLMDGRPHGYINTPEHQQAALRIAEQAIVLLKNAGNTLPLNAKTIKNLLIVGDNATRLQAHSGGSTTLKAFFEVTPLDGLLKLVGKEVNVTYSAGYGADLGSDAAERAVAAAAHANAVIFVGGLNHQPGFDCEGSDRKNLDLPYGQAALIRRLAAVNPRTVVVLMNGGPVKMSGWLDKVPAILEAWYPGMEGGNAIARILFGEVNPSGKLPCTFPKSLSDSPAHALHAYPGKDGQVVYKEGLLVGYRWYDTKKIAPMFPFGFGLSYTTFRYSNLKLIKSAEKSGARVTVRFDITNTGSRAGAEVAEIYVHEMHPRLERPEKALKGFDKVELKPGETRTVTIPLSESAFSYYDPSQHGWVADNQDFTIMVGSSSRDIRFSGNFHLVPVKD